MNYYEAVKEIRKHCQETDWVYDEVITEFIKYCRNNPTEDYYDHMKSAISATAHQ